MGVPGEYLCLSRLQALELSSRDGGMSGYEMDVRRFYASVFNWASYTTSGHYSGLRIPQGLYSLWSEVACPGDDSCGDTCPFVSQCYLKLANCLASKCPTVMLSWEKAVEPGNEYDIAVVWAFHELDRKIAWNDPWVDIGRLREIACTLVVEDKLPSLDYINRTMEGKLPKGDKVLSGELYRLAGWLAGEMREVQKSFHIRGRPVVSKEHNLFEKFTRDLNEVITNSDGTVPILEPAYRPNGSTALAFSRRTLWPGAKATEMLSQNSRGTYLLSNVADTIAGLRAAPEVRHSPRYHTGRRERPAATI